MSRIKRFSLTNAMIDCESLSQALSLHEHLTNHPERGQVELIPAAQTVLVRFDTAENTSRFITSFTLPEHVDAEDGQVETRVIETVYDGEDLAEVAALAGLSEQGVIDAHTGADWRVAFAGFAPGFFYLHAEDNVLNVPRRSSPRTAVPAGAVGLAGALSGIYPRQSPGGWQLIGRTNAPLWDLSQAPPALLEPGMKVQFKAVRELIEVRAESNTRTSSQVRAEDAILRVDSPGIQTLIQDAGRPHLAHWGVSPSGFADAPAAREANRLVGNELNTPVLENLGGGLRITAGQDAVLAVTGASVEGTITPVVQAAQGAQSAQMSDAGSDETAENANTADSLPKQLRQYTPFALKAGETLTLGPASSGLRAYVALRGGFAAEAQANSASRDTLSSIGAQPLASGDFLAGANLHASAVAVPSTPLPLPGDDMELRVILGPRDDWFTAQSLSNFVTAAWKVSNSSDRIGVRLVPDEMPAGPGHVDELLERTNTAELPSEGMVTGAIQVPPNGEPVVFLTDHPVTGGYPVIASVLPADLRLLAQAPPETRIRFTEVDPSTLDINPSDSSDTQKENHA